MNPQRPMYKKYRIYLNTLAGNWVIAASDTVNNLVGLSKDWLLRTTTGAYLPSDIEGTIILQELDEVTGAYKRGLQLTFKNKKDIITQLRKLGGR